MKVLQFAFDGAGQPSTCRTATSANAVVYTGTHDNDTTPRLVRDARARGAATRVRDYLGSDGREIEWDLIRAAYASVAERAIVPLQDVLGLGSEARMNTPVGAGAATGPGGSPPTPSARSFPRGCDAWRSWPGACLRPAS